MRLLILGLLLVATVWLIARGLKGRGADGKAGESTRPLVQDPVCKTFLPREGALVVHRGGTDHYFCSERCAERFKRGHA